MHAKEKFKREHSKQAVALPTLLPTTAGYAAMGAGFASLGVTAECAHGSKPPPKPITFFLKSVSAAAREKELADKFKTDADARKLTREKQ